MTYDEKLASRVRDGLAGISCVAEKRMFGGLAFIINDRMCVTVGNSRIMCRIDPAIQRELVRKKGCQVMTMGGREYNGYVRVEARVLRRKDQLEFWIGLALKFNRKIASTV